MLHPKGLWRVRSYFEPVRQAYPVAIFLDWPDGRASVATNFALDEYEPGEIVEPTLQDGRQFLQAALGCAWELGLRPAGFEDTRESMKATQAHLQDLRALVFKRTPKGL